MNEEEGLLLIQKMITTAKEDIEDNSFYFLLWGWLVFAACLVHFILMQLNLGIDGIGWLILMPLGAVLSVIYGYRHDRKLQVRSYINDVMKYVLISFLVSLFIVLGSMRILGLSTYPMIMLIYGTWLFISGGSIKFRPLILGGIVNWMFAIAALFVQFEQQLVSLAFAVLLGYIIPGHLLRRKYRMASVAK